VDFLKKAIDSAASYSNGANSNNRIQRCAQRL
jgi:hypothetical protein